MNSPSVQRIARKFEPSAGWQKSAAVDAVGVVSGASDGDDASLSSLSTCASSELLASADEREKPPKSPRHARDNIRSISDIPPHLLDIVAKPREATHRRQQSDPVTSQVVSACDCVTGNGTDLKIVQKSANH